MQHTFGDGYTPSPAVIGRLESSGSGKFVRYEQTGPYEVTPVRYQATYMAALVEGKFEVVKFIWNRVKLTEEEAADWFSQKRKAHSEE